MNVDGLSNSSSVASLFASQLGSSTPTNAQIAADRQALSQSATTSAASGTAAAPGKSKTTTAADIKKAASQFEAIILRQLLAPSIEPMTSGGGMGGESGSSSAGSGIYGYMLTDALATNLSKAGGLGLGKMLEKQLSPKHPAVDPLSDSTSKTTKS